MKKTAYEQFCAVRTAFLNLLDVIASELWLYKIVNWLESVLNKNSRT